MYTVTVETGDQGTPGYIQAVYEIVPNGEVTERSQMSPEMVRQLTLGGWRITDVDHE